MRFFLLCLLVLALSYTPFFESSKSYAEDAEFSLEIEEGEEEEDEGDEDEDDAGSGGSFSSSSDNPRYDFHWSTWFAPETSYQFFFNGREIFQGVFDDEGEAQWTSPSRPGSYVILAEDPEGEQSHMNLNLTSSRFEQWVYNMSPTLHSRLEENSIVIYGWAKVESALTVHVLGLQDDFFYPVFSSSTGFYQIQIPLEDLKEDHYSVYTEYIHENNIGLLNYESFSIQRDPEKNEVTHIEVKEDRYIENSVETEEKLKNKLPQMEDKPSLPEVGCRRFADFNRDCRVNDMDLIYLRLRRSISDLNLDQIIDLEDYSIISYFWTG